MMRGKARPRSVGQRQTRESLNLANEVRTIKRRVADQDGCIVNIGPLLSFSTNMGDAWMLEPADHLAVRLARGGGQWRKQVEITR